MITVMAERSLAERAYEQFRTVGDDRVPLLVGPGRNPGTIFEYEQRNIEAIAEPDKTRRLREACMSSTPANCAGWFSDNADALSSQPRESDDNILCEIFVNFKKESVSITWVMTSRISYGWFGFSESRSFSPGRDSSPASYGTDGGSSSQFCGM